MSLFKDIVKASEEKRKSSFNERISFLKDEGKETSQITDATNEVLDRLKKGEKSFVIYGEPQSGKTELMLALTCKVFDAGYETVFIVMNDNVSLEEQNYTRFIKCDQLEATPLKYEELKEDDSPLVPGQKHVIFCRKNAINLDQIIDVTRKLKKRIVFDDEADYASPDSNINKPEVDPTKINQLVGKLITRSNDPSKPEECGIYIGVTATPGRLDLNNTFANEPKEWVFVDPYPGYVGRIDFFPSKASDRKFKLKQIPDDTFEGRHLKEAIYRFILRNAYVNLLNPKARRNFSMLIHNSGKIDDHSEEKKVVQKIVNDLKMEGRKQERVFESLEKIAQQIFTDEEKEAVPTKDLLIFVYENRDKTKVLVINSKTINKGSSGAAQNPQSQFTFALGGNIISRGLTFNNLLSFFFTRTVKQKLQHNTYIQRARMFGARGDYLEHFELTVPKALLGWWADCFTYHELSLATTKAGEPAWLQTRKTSAADRASINRNTVDIATGEMKIGNIFKLNDEIEKVLLSKETHPIATIESLLRRGLIKADNFPKSFLTIFKQQENYEKTFMFVLGESEILSIHGWRDADHENLARARGLVQPNIHNRSQFNRAGHLLMPIRNDQGNCRFYYKSMKEYSILQNKPKL